jgi:hypothetical protein
LEKTSMLEGKELPSNFLHSNNMTSAAQAAKGGKKGGCAMPLRFENGIERKEPAPILDLRCKCGAAGIVAVQGKARPDILVQQSPATQHRKF